MMSSPDILLGIHNFRGRSEDELDIQRGDYIALIEDDSEFNDSWYLGHNLTTDLSGLFPKSFTAPITDIPPEIKRRRAELYALNPSNPPGEIMSVATHDAGANSVNTSQNLMADSSNVSYERIPQMYQGFQELSAMSTSPRQPDAQQPALSKLTLQDPSSPSTDLSVANVSGPDSVSSVEVGYGNTSIGGGADHSKRQMYEQSAPQMSQSSAIDAAISDMNKPRGSHSQICSGLSRSTSQLSAQHSVSQPNASNSALALTPVVASVLSWTPAQVEAYFAAKGLVEDASKFVKHKITGVILLEMDRETLKEIDIVSFGPRFEIDKEIRILRQAVGFPPVGSPKSPETSPLSNQSYNAMLALPMANNLMNSVSNTPIAAQDNSFVLPSQNDASTTTLSGASQSILSSPRHAQYQASFSQGQLPFSSASSPTVRSDSGDQQLDGYSQSPSSSYRSISANGYSQGSHMQRAYAHGDHQYSNYASTQSRSNGAAYQKYGQQPHLHYPQRQPISVGNLKSGSEEEITGSLPPDFSLKANDTAISATQAAEKSHHRRSSSATSRYSSVPSHQRNRTMEDWDPSLQQTLPKEEHSPRKGHNRHSSRGSVLSGFRNDQSQGMCAHSPRNSADLSKQKRRSSMLSLLSGSPKKSQQGAHLTGSPRVGSPNGTQNSVPSLKGTPASSNSGNSKLSSSENNTLKSLIRPGLIKQKTSAFQEGIQSINAEMAASSADKSGWMHKRGGSGIGMWSKRFFTLHGTRLSYFTNFKDSKERGLIDITGHRVVMIKDHEILVNLSAAGMGAGRHCFKLVPPGPGYKKGVAFTAPKVHYFAVDSAEEMREWQSALMSATIERDESIPVESTCKLPTISLSKAQELMAERLKLKGEIGSLTK